MKKTGSKVLAATLVAGSMPIQVLATENVSEIENNEDILSIKNQVSVIGKLELDINFAIPIINTQSDMKVVLKGEGITESISLVNNSGVTQSGVSYTIEKLKQDKKTTVNDNEDISFIRIIFDKLPIGTYSFDLSASGYKTVSVDNLDITKYSKRVKIGTQEKEVAISYNEDGSINQKEIYQALFLVGDINSDNTIDMEDYNIILNNIDKNNAEHDLNKDGKIDISDLSYLKGSIGSESKAPIDRSYIEDTDAIINPENIGVGIPSDAILPEGSDIKDLLKSDAPSVKIEREVAPSVDNPLSIKMNLTGTSIPGEENTEQPELATYVTNDAITMEKVVIKAPNVDGSPETGNIVYTDETGQKHTLAFGSENTKTLKSGDKEISIDLGSQVAVKEISIDVTGNRGNKNISEIAKIEFLNNVYKEIPKPVISIPTIKTLETSTNLHDERMTISWEPQPNVTGYEVKYYKINEKGEAIGPIKKLQTNEAKMNIKDKQIKPYDTFRVSIQSLNGDWSSGYAEDLVGKDEALGGIIEGTDKYKELIPNSLDGLADNVDKDFNPKESYYGNNANNIEPNMGSVTDIQVVPIQIPDPPKNMLVKEAYRSLNVTWENHIQARDFDIYYRKLGSKEEKDDKWIKANDKSIGAVSISDEAVTNPDKTKLSRGGSYTITGLDDQSSYEIRVTATNHHGTSIMSQTALATTTTISPPKTTDYKLINRPKQNVADGEIPAENVINVENSSRSNVKYDNEFAVIDNDYSTNYTIEGWNRGGDAPIIEFDKEYTIDRINAVFNEEFNPPYLYKPQIIGYDAEGNEIKRLGNIESYYPDKDANGKKYFQFKLDEPMKVKKIKVIMNVYPQNTTKISVSEIKFYETDNVGYEVANLFEDEFRIKLNEWVTQSKIDDLVKRINTMDPVSLEYNPDRSTILSELEAAQKLLNEVDLSDEIITLDPMITSKHGGVSLGMSNDWQSVGSVVRPGKDENGNAKKIVVYMGKNSSKVNVKLGFLQTYDHVGTNIIQEYTLKPGRNEFTIPTSKMSEDVEKGGQLMIKIEKGNPQTEVKIRLGTNNEKIPHLNVNNLINDKTKESEVKDKIRVYIRELKKYVADLPSKYPSEITSEDKINNIYKYDPKTSVLNNTDVEGDRVTLTLPATEILKSIEQGIASNEDAQVERTYKALIAWEQQMQLAYAKKGVYESIDKAPSEEEYNLHKAPLTRMNIKYQRPMMGANAYASSHHVGVEFGLISAYMQGIPLEFDENNNAINATTAKYYGGIMSHEIGHILDTKQRVYQETSNDLLTNLTGSLGNQGGGSYSKVYKKVTSHTAGLSTDRGVVRAMLWQPYLAYENEDTYKMMIDNNGSYFAELNRAYRTLTDAETVNADKDQLLMRVSSKVVGKDLSNFYIAHGMRPNADTIKYISQFPKEERPIQYINDEARRQRLAGTDTMAKDTEVVAKFGKDGEGKQITTNSYVNQDRVPINLSVTKDNDKILGYEIIRNGKAVGFIEKNKDGGMTTYNDVVDNVNNRVFKYEVIAYDYALNKTEKANLGTIKVRHDGSVNKDKIILSSNTKPLNDNTYNKHDENPNKTLKYINDKDKSSVYEGKVHDDACSDHEDEGHVHEKDAYVILDANEVRSLAGIKYTAPTTTSKFFKKEKTLKNAIQNFEIQISKDGKSWTKVKEGQFKLDPNNPTETIYFDKEETTGGNQLNVYNTRFVKLIAKGSDQIAAAELDLIAPPGDNIEIGVANDNINYKNGVGLLKEDFVYQVDNPSTSENEERKITKGSVVITGEYRGNPAFNVPLVLNENEEHIADKYKGLLMAEVPDNGNLEEISEGNWVYWVEPQYVNQFMQNQQVFAELYRTDTADAQSGGQRLVSDTFKIDVPDELPQISLSDGQGRTLSESKKVVEIDTKAITKVVNNR